MPYRPFLNRYRPRLSVDSPPATCPFLFTDFRFAEIRSRCARGIRSIEFSFAYERSDRVLNRQLHDTISN